MNPLFKLMDRVIGKKEKEKKYKEYNEADYIQVQEKLDIPHDAKDVENDFGLLKNVEVAMTAGDNLNEMKGGKMEELEELEEFGEDVDLEEEPIEQPMIKSIKPKEQKQPVKAQAQPKAKAKEVAKPVEVPMPQPQYVPVPKVVSMETMLNELYDGQQEIKQALLTILSAMENPK